MRILEGHLSLSFQGEQFRCPIAGVRDTAGEVEAAVATPFGLRRVIVKLDAERKLIEAHTFAFDYESGAVSKFEQAIIGGPVGDDPHHYAGTISGGGLEGRWEVYEQPKGEDEADEAAAAFGIAARVPAEVTPAPEKPENGA